MDRISIKFSVNNEGMIDISFPNAKIIESDDGPMMGITCDINSAVYLGGAIIHEALSILEYQQEQDE